MRIFWDGNVKSFVIEVNQIKNYARCNSRLKPDLKWYFLRWLTYIMCVVDNLIGVATLGFVDSNLSEIVEDEWANHTEKLEETNYYD